MRPRINKRVNVQEVVDALEYRRKQYSEAIGQIMLEENVSYSQAKKLLESRLKEKVIFKF
jgi:predicted transcriptional regulator